LSTASQQTLSQLSAVFVDRLFLATYGVHFQKGLAGRSFEVAERALIASARQITLVCDSSKFQQRRTGAHLSADSGPACHHRRCDAGARP